MATLEVVAAIYVIGQQGRPVVIVIRAKPAGLAVRINPGHPTAVGEGIPEGKDGQQVAIGIFG